MIFSFHNPLFQYDGFKIDKWKFTTVEPYFMFLKSLSPVFVHYLFIPLKLYIQFSELKLEAWEIIVMVLFFSTHIDFLKCSVWED